MSIDTTKSIYLLKLLDALREQDLDVRPLLEVAELTQADLAGRDRQIAIGKYLLAVEEAVSRYAVPDLGFLVGERTRIMEHGLLSYALLSSSNLRDSLDRYVRYQFLQGPLLVVAFDVSGDMASMTATPRGGRWRMSPLALRYIVQEWLVGWNQWCRIIGRTETFFEHVQLGYSRDCEQSYYEDHLGCTVSFDNHSTTALFHARRLDAPLEYADSSIAALCSAQCQWLLEVLNVRAGLATEIHVQLAKKPGNVPTMAEISRILNIGTRTLRRRLRDEGTTYRSIVAEYRVAMARRYLEETSLPANEVASLVGYSDPANLYRTFQKATGFTPDQYRQSATTTGLYQ